MCRDNSVTLKKKEETLVTYDCCLNTLYRYAESKDRMYLIEILALLLLIKLKRFEGERNVTTKASRIIESGLYDFLVKVHYTSLPTQWIESHCSGPLQ